MKSNKWFIIAIIAMAVTIVSFEYYDWRTSQAYKERSNLLFTLTLETGYGGAIHHFKNYILRADSQNYTKAKTHIYKVLSALDHYPTRYLSAKELNALNSVRSTYEQYLLNLNTANRLYQEKQVSVTEVDQFVKIDDMPAVKAIDFLVDQLKQSHQSSQATDIKLKALMYTFLLILVLSLLYTDVKLGLKQKALLKSIAQLNHANEEILEFSYRTSHDLKAPLHSIKSLCKIAEMDLQHQETNEVNQNLKRIENLAIQLEILVTSVLSLAKLNHEQPVQLPLNFSAILEELSQRYELALDQGCVSLKCLVDELPTVYGNPSQYIHILANLIENGIKYANPERSDKFVKVNIGQVKNCLTITVSDNGLGIPANQQHRLFDMFEVFHPNIAKGVGLGLYMVKKTVIEMGGTIECYSSSEGTQFEISVPQAFKKRTD